MPGNTPAGIPYADPGDQLSSWPATSKSGAEKVPHVQAGQATVAVSSATVGTVSVTFPRAFKRAPRVAVAVAGTSTWFAYVSTSPSLTSIVIGARQYKDIAQTANLPIQWIAVDPAGSV